MSTTTATICWPSKFWLKWVAVFLGSLVVGILLALATRKKDEVIIPKPKVAITFEVYDSQGNPVNAVLIEDNKENPGKKSTQFVGTPRDLFFKRKDTKDTPITEHVIWRTKPDYINWLDGDFRKKLNNLYPDNNKAKWDKIITSIKSDVSDVDQRYPIVFPAH